ncbi:peptidase U35 phage prohead HK97 [Methylobacterium sp. 4-46]|uniref:HK97 family phage prohead protease n=1 Tax=unclassified Methylobacterium TaxID=2615210 RepID=UPI000152DB56|nr:MULTISPECIES: HK97 family phage prohead protease [Methylobacterium]ACA15683.1 peptidase U35 phage prohead HK97 [Methylobacterium sp. 4-46]WFT81395.1 HK97 family phage prohead protease [Methylobacterium nodulans]
MSTTRTIYRAASLRSQSFNETENTIEVVWTTGAPVRRYSFVDGEEFDEVLSLEPGAVRLEKLNQGAPFCDTHMSESVRNVIGVVVPGSARIVDGKGIATIKLSDTDDVRDAVRKIKTGIVRSVSVGYSVFEVHKTEARDGQPATWEVTDWEPLEISLVPVPADAGCHVRSAKAPDGGKAKGSSRSAKPAKAAAKPSPKGRMSPASIEAQRRAEVYALAVKAGREDLGREAAESGMSVRAFKSRLLTLLTAEGHARDADPRDAARQQERREFRAAEKHWRRVAGRPV